MAVTKPKPDVRSAFLTKEGEESPEHADEVLNELFDISLTAEKFINRLDRLIEETMIALEELQQKEPEDEELRELLANKHVQKFLEEITEHKGFRLADERDIQEILDFIKNLGHLAAVNEHLSPIDQIGLRALKKYGLRQREKKKQAKEKITRER